MTVEFDDAGHAASDLARIWVDASPGERSRITKAAHDVENVLAQNPQLERLTHELRTGRGIAFRVEAEDAGLYFGLGVTTRRWGW